MISLTSQNELNQDLNLINHWAFQWKIVFNPDATKQAVEVLFSRKRTDHISLPIIFNDEQVVLQRSHKHLGIILDNQLNFNLHIKEKTA